MKELKDIAAAYERALQQGQQTALATVVQVQGSSYRRPGARLLVTENGELTGAISGGCLEGDALRKARLAMLQQRNMLVTYDTMDEDDATLGIGLGCNGIIHVLIEPVIAEDDNNPVQMIRAFLARRQSAALVTLFSLENRRAAQPGTVMLLNNSGGSMRSAALPAGLQPALAAHALAAIQGQASLIQQYPGGLTGLVALLEPPVSLLVFGAGNDVLPLTQLAAVMGWETTIIDGRAAHTNARRFPQARVLTARPGNLPPQLAADRYTAALLMTHNYNHDLAALRQLLPLGLPYIGALGPRKKLERMLDALQAEGALPGHEALECIYGPTGLDIGAETMEEIALSILAEIKAVLAGRAGAPLRNLGTPIHERPQLLDAAQLPVT